jgi:hypothetical protein
MLNLANLACKIGGDLMMYEQFPTQIRSCFQADVSFSFVFSFFLLGFDPLVLQKKWKLNTHKINLLTIQDSITILLLLLLLLLFIIHDHEVNLDI